MKTVTVDILYYEFGRSVNGKTVPPTNADYTKFLSELTMRKNAQAATIKKMLNRGGFVYAPELWKWTVKRDNKNISLWLRLTFEDYYNDGKTIFMSMIKKTGLIPEYGNIVKSYS